MVYTRWSVVEEIEAHLSWADGQTGHNRAHAKAEAEPIAPPTYLVLYDYGYLLVVANPLLFLDK